MQLCGEERRHHFGVDNAQGIDPCKPKLFEEKIKYLSTESDVSKIEFPLAMTPCRGNVDKGLVSLGESQCSPVILMRDVGWQLMRASRYLRGSLRRHSGRQGCRPLNSVLECPTDARLQVYLR